MANPITFERKITLGNLLTIGGMVVAVTFSFWALQSSVSAQGRDISTLQRQVEPIPDMVRSLALVQQAQSAGKDRGDDMRVSIKELSSQNLQILQSLAAISARLNEMDKRP